jgi:hypothetical protein
MNTVIADGLEATTSELLTRGAPLPRPAERRLSMPAERLMNHYAKVQRDENGVTAFRCQTLRSSTD